jgi:hypothetical protein
VRRVCVVRLLPRVRRTAGAIVVGHLRIHLCRLE